MVNAMNRLSREEVEAVVRLVSQRRAIAYGSAQTVDSLAHALSLSPGQVEDYLRDIRNGDTFTDRVEFRRAVIGGGIAAGVLLLLVVGNLVFGSSKEPVAARGTAPVAEAGAAFPQTAAPHPGFGAGGVRTVVEAPTALPASGPTVQEVASRPAQTVDSGSERRRMIGEAGDKARREAQISIQAE